MVSHTVVVTGATGALGRPVVAELLAQGHSVRAVTRRPNRADVPAGAHTVPGDLCEPSSLETAFAAADSLVLIAVADTSPEVLARARTAGIEHVVVVSSAAVTAGYDTSYHLPVEVAAQNSGLTWSIVRPGEFAMNALLIWGPSIRQHRRVIEPFPDQHGSPVHEQDIADAIVAHLTDPHRHGRIDTLIGPDTLTKRQQVAHIAAAIDSDIALEQVTAEQARRFYRSQGGFAADNADFLFGFESYDGAPGETDEAPELAPA
jgi:uncharacterized protein YbjT (DUF2867 family)